MGRCKNQQNDSYVDITWILSHIAYSTLNITYKDSDLIIIKKNCMPGAMFAEVASLPFQHGGFERILKAATYCRSC